MVRVLIGLVVSWNGKVKTLWVIRGVCEGDLVEYFNARLGVLSACF